MKKNHAVISPIMIAALLCAAPVPPAAAADDTDRGRVPQWRLAEEKGIRTFGEGRLETHAGIPFVKLGGTPYEMGYQYGALLKDEIHSSYGEMQKTIDAFFTLVPPILRPLARLMYNIQASKKAKAIPERYREELRGFADATGLDYGYIIRVIFSADIVGALGCSSVIVNNGGNLIHGRNLDYTPSNLGRYPLIMEMSPRGKRSYTLLSIMGYLPALSGMSDAGIAITLNISFLTEEIKKPGVPVGYKAREVLEDAATLADVDRLLSGYVCDGGWFFTISSASEKTGAIYEMAGPEIRKNPLTSTFIFVENRYLHDELNRRYKQIEEAAGDYNENRICRVAELAPKVKSVNDMVALLGNTDYYSHKNAYGKFTVNNYETVQSMVLLPGTGDIYFSTAPMYAAFARMILYNRNTGKVSVFREADPRLNDPAIQGLLASADLFYVDPDRALREISPDKANLLQISFAYRLWCFDEDLYKLETLIPSIDRWLAVYPDDANLYRIKGHALLETKRYDRAIETLEAGLKSTIAAPADLMYIHALLAKAYKKADQKEKASLHAGTALDMMAKYQLNSDQKKLKRELKWIR